MERSLIEARHHTRPVALHNLFKEISRINYETLMTSIFKMKQEHDAEKRAIHAKVFALYKQMGEPFKPEQIKKKGKFGAVTYEDKHLTIDEMLQKMMRVEHE